MPEKREREAPENAGREEEKGYMRVLWMEGRGVMGLTLPQVKQRTGMIIFDPPPPPLPPPPPSLEKKERGQGFSGRRARASERRSRELRF